MDNGDLDPRIVAALRDVEPASDRTREWHIATALGVADGPATSIHRRFPTKRGWLSSAAAAVALLAVGTAFGRSTVHRSPTEPAPGAPTTTMPPKTGAGGCAIGNGPLGDVGWVRNVEIAGVAYVFVGRDGSIDVLRDDTACTKVATFPVPSK